MSFIDIWLLFNELYIVKFFLYTAAVLPLECFFSELSDFFIHLIKLFDSFFPTAKIFVMNGLMKQPQPFS